MQEWGTQMLRPLNNKNTLLFPPKNRPACKLSCRMQIRLISTKFQEDVVGLKLTLFGGHPTLMGEGVRDAEDKRAYPAEFRQQMIELAQAGRHPAELSREFGPTSQRIINWVAQGARDVGKNLPGKDGLSSAELDELSRLRRGESPAQDGARHPGKGYGLVRQKERCGFSEPFELVMTNQTDFPVHDVPRPGNLCRRLLRLEYPGAECATHGQRGAHW